MKENVTNMMCHPVVCCEYVPLSEVLMDFFSFSLQTLWGMETPGQADNQRDLAIQANKKKVRFRATG